MEERIALSATPATITEISVASSSWTPAFTSKLEADGLGTANTLADGSVVLETAYAIPGGADQTDPIPWDNVDQIRVTFSKDVEVQQSDLAITGVTTTQVSVADFDYYPELRLGIWDLSAPLGDDRYLVSLNADGIDPIVDLAGNVLDGDWTDAVSTTSGDGVAGGDFDFSLNVLAGDALGIGVREWNNLLDVYQRAGFDTTSVYYSPRADVDGDGLIETSDWMTIYGDMFATLPSGTPAGVTNSAPSSQSLGYSSITDDTLDVAFSLWNAFDDEESSDSQLTYSIASNSNSGLFDAVWVDSASGNLMVNTASNSTGRAEVVVNAVDQSGLTSQSTVTIDVGRQNVAPSLTVTTTDGGNGLWKIEGWVTDPDDDLDDMVVLLSGLFFARVSVAEDGYFAYAALLDPNAAGFMFAETFDGEDLSQAVYFEIGWV
ncbi:MAG: cadherin repeat domain-containing protein [Planctomycetota bacterium]